MTHQPIKDSTNSMYISSLQISNNKVFLKTDPMIFQPGFNIILGKNGAGKSTLLDALRLSLPGGPHRSILTMPNSGQDLANKESEGYGSLQVEKTRVKELLTPSVGE